MAAQNVYQAINAVQAELSTVGITKDRVSEGQKYKFRGIDDVYNTISPLLAKHKLVILPRCLERNVAERKTAKGTVMFYVDVKMEFDFVSSEDGSKHTVCTFGEAMDSGDKATNKAMSIAYKYACFQVFAIPTEGDNDPDAHIPPPILDGREACRQDLVPALADMARVQTIDDLKQIYNWAKGRCKDYPEMMDSVDAAAKKRKAELEAQPQSTQPTQQQLAN